MGITLIPVKRSSKPLDFNWSAWAFLLNNLEAWGIDLYEFSTRNDGSTLSQAICEEVAAAIEANLHQLAPEDQAWLGEQIETWRLSGGFEQW